MSIKKFKPSTNARQYIMSYLTSNDLPNVLKWSGDGYYDTFEIMDWRELGYNLSPYVKEDDDVSYSLWASDIRCNSSPDRCGFKCEHPHRTFSNRFLADYDKVYKKSDDQTELSHIILENLLNRYLVDCLILTDPVEQNFMIPEVRNFIEHIQKYHPKVDISDFDGTMDNYIKSGIFTSIDRRTWQISKEFFDFSDLFAYMMEF